MSRMKMKKQEKRKGREMVGRKRGEIGNKCVSPSSVDRSGLFSNGQFCQEHALEKIEPAPAPLHQEQRQRASNDPTKSGV